MLEFRLVNESDEWDKYVSAIPRTTFLNSTAREKYINKFYGENIKIAIFKDNSLFGIFNYFFSTFALKGIKLGKYIFAQHSPVFLNPQSVTIDEWDSILGYLNDVGKKNNCFLIRIEPMFLKGEREDLMNKLNDAPIHNIDSLISRRIEINKPDEEIIAGTNMSSRQNIRKCLKDEKSSTKIVTGREGIDIFFKLHEQTTKDKRYVERPRDVLEYELQQYLESNMLHMVVGYYDNQPSGIWVNVLHKDVLWVYQAAIDSQTRNENRRISYLLFFKSAILGRDLGCKYLDMFGGMKPEDAPQNHPWSGIGAFKEGLGGNTITYSHVKDIVLKKSVYAIFELNAKRTLKRFKLTSSW